jgi:hypothetical protein
MVGHQVVLDSVDRKIVEMRYGMKGLVADGILFRVSSIEKDSAKAFKLQESFVSELLAALSVKNRQRIAGI